MARTTNSDTLPFVDSRYELGMLASQRVRDLNGGAEMVVEKKNDKPTVIALREIATGELDINKLRHEFIQSYKETSALSEDESSLEIKSEDPLLREIDAELDAVLIEEPATEEDASDLVTPDAADTDADIDAESPESAE